MTTPQQVAHVTYGDGTDAQGNYVLDTVSLEGTVLKKFQFIDVDQFTTQITIEQPWEPAVSGLIGLGAKQLEAGADANFTYHNLPSAMVDAGLIKSDAYSLWLDDIESIHGQLLFGGLNRAKYEGDLVTMDIYPDAKGIINVMVPLTGISVKSGSRGNFDAEISEGLPALIDSGTSVIMLPTFLFKQVLEVLEGRLDLVHKIYVAPCSGRNTTDTKMVFSFGQLNIEVQLSELILPPKLWHSIPSHTKLFDEDGVPYCLLGLAENTADKQAILGDSFMRSAYIVYDQTGSKITMAQSKKGSKKDDIVELKVVNHTAIIPGAVSATYSTVIPSTAYGSDYAAATPPIKEEDGQVGMVELTAAASFSKPSSSSTQSPNSNSAALSAAHGSYEAIMHTILLQVAIVSTAGLLGSLLVF
jgi:hypothetical protein